MRLDLQKTEPEAYQAVYALEKYLGKSRLSPTHRELIKLRASQVNGCLYCIDLHTRDARRAGETEQRLYLLPVWREAGTLFTPEERALLALTEEVTNIGRHVSEATYQRAAAVFDEQYLAQAIMAIATINVWNRIAIATEKPLD